MYFSGTILSPLHSLLYFLGMLFAGDAGVDEAGKTKDDQHSSDEGDAGNGDDDGNDDDDDSNDDDDDTADDDTAGASQKSGFGSKLGDRPSDEEVRRNAHRLDSEKDEQLTITMEAFVDSLVDNPSTAEAKLAKFRENDPVLAAKLVRMYKNQQNNQLGGLLDKADPAVRDAFQSLSEQVATLTEKTQQQTDSEDKRTYLDWEKEAHPYLSPKSTEGKTKIGGRLREAFYSALDRISPAGQALDNETLEDALVIAKRKVGWNDKKVKRALDKFATEQAARGRSISVSKGGKGVGGKEQVNADPKVAEMFNNTSPERLKKIAEEKSKAGFKQ